MENVMAEKCLICHLEQNYPEAFDKVTKYSVDGKISISDICQVNNEFKLDLTESDFVFHELHSFQSEDLLASESIFADTYSKNLDPKNAYIEAFDYQGNDAEEKGRLLLQDTRISSRILWALEDKKELANQSRDDLIVHLIEIWGFALDGEPVYDSETGEPTGEHRTHIDVALGCLNSIARLMGHFDNPKLDPETEKKRSDIFERLMNREVTATAASLEIELLGIQLPEIFRLLAIKENFGQWGDILETLFKRNEYQN
jgi:hypothetical protein